MTVTPGYVYREGQPEDSFPQVTVPVIAKSNDAGIVKPRVATEEALRVTNKEPINTVWAWSTGRPIYDRLPAVAGSYQQDYRTVYERDQQDQAFVYLEPPFQSGIGPGSLEPSKQLNDFKVLQFQNGEITWSAGTLKVDRYQINTGILNNGLGLQDGAYQAGYLLSATQPAPPAYVTVPVEDSLLGLAQIGFAASDQWPGHPAKNALTGPDLPGSWWPREFSIAGDYSEGSWYVLDFYNSGQATSFAVEGDPSMPATAYCSLYSSDDAIIWYKQDQQLPTENKYFFQDTMELKRYQKFFFWGRSNRNNIPLKANIETIRFSGDLGVPNYTSITPSPFAEPYIDDLYEAIDQDYLLVCTFNIRKGVIEGLQDQRQFIYRDYQPVAEWLTTFQDTSLKCLFDDVVNYSTKSMAPPTSCYNYYEELDDSLCFGRGFLNVGNVEDALTIDFPTVVLLDPIIGERQLFQPDVRTDPTPGDLIETDPTADSIKADGTSSIRTGGIAPKEIWELRWPSLPGSAANVAYVDFTLNLSWSIDNGIY